LRQQELKESCEEKRIGKEREVNVSFWMYGRSSEKGKLRQCEEK
jgi:hypothetical protein